MSQLNEQLLPGDLENLVQHIFEVDSYQSKMGDDSDIVVLAFKTDALEAAKDLVNFIERGYDFVLDADTSSGELNDGTYNVFVEIERSRYIARQINEILFGLKKLTDHKEFRFRYYKSFHSEEATLENMEQLIPKNKQEYQNRISQDHLNNFTNFFNRSYVESINIDNDDLIFRKRYAEPLRMRIKQYGDRAEIYENLPGRYMFEQYDVGQILFLTKYIGDYNISKIGNVFVFEHDSKAVVLEKI